MSGQFELRIEWLDAPGVSTPALSATWARYEIWVAGRCVTQVEAPDGTFRRSVFGSLYPLAEWIASNWWTLTSHIRPSAIDTVHWTWPNVRTYPWLRQHNVRGAGDGMAWPDMTFVVEGPITRIMYAQEASASLAPIRFAAAGSAIIGTEDAKQGLATVVDHVLERLAEEGIPKTRLAEEWDAIAKAGDEEREFCRTVAQLGLDPYSVHEETAAQVIEIASSLPGELVADFFDSADPAALPSAARWAMQAIRAAKDASATASNELSALYDLVHPDVDETTASIGRPWVAGYAMARRARRELGIQHTQYFDTSPWVGVGEVDAPSNGLQGTAIVHEDRCGLVLGGPRIGESASRFGQARALGRVLTRPQQHSFVLSAARGHDERLAGAFAAELLAPAEGIRHSLEEIGEHTDAAFDAIAGYFRVSPLLVRHQYDNQLARMSEKVVW